MALVISDRIKETTTTTGTGTYTLAGAVTGFETFTANLSNSDTTYYACTDGTDFEVGLGTFTSSGTTLARTTILSSSNSNNEVSWSSGTRTIFCTLPAAKAVFKDASGHVNLSDNEEIKLGADGDLVIRHAGSNSLIEDNGGGSLIVKANPIFKLEKSGSSELMIEANADGAVELYHDNSKKFETTSSGATVTGTLAATLSTAAQTNVTSLGTLTGLTTSGNIELGHASDTTLARSSAGVVTIEGNTIITTGNSDTPTTTTSSSDADFVLVDDGGTMKKITPTNLGIGSGASKGFAVAMAIAL